MFHVQDWAIKQSTSQNDYTGIIVGINDPNKSNRAQVRIPFLHEGIPNELLPWFRNGNISDNVKGRTKIDLPVIGATVKVKFENMNFYNGIFYEGLKSTKDNDTNFLSDYGSFNGESDQWGNSYKFYDSKALVLNTSFFSINANRTMFDGTLGTTSGFTGVKPMPDGSTLIIQDGIIIGG